MKIQINYLGMISDITGIRKEQIETTENITLTALRNLIEKKYVNLKDLVYKVAIDDALVHDSVPIIENSEITLLPPYAGG